MNKQKRKEDENRGIFFFYCFPIGLGIAYGIFGIGFIRVVPWWIETILVSLVLSAAHILVRSWKITEYIKQCFVREQKSSLWLFFSLQTVENAAMIFIPALIIIGIRFLLNGVT